MTSRVGSECGGESGWHQSTVDGLALRQVAVVLAGEQRIAIAAHDALNVAVKPLENVEKMTKNVTYPYFTL